MLDYRNKIYIFVLVFYSFTTILSVVRLIQHGLMKATAERVIGIFSIARILTAAFQLATIKSPNNTSLWAGYLTTFSICVSLLLSSALLLLQRLATRSGAQIPRIAGRNPMRLCQIFIYVGLILGIVGGIKTNENWGGSGSYTPDSTLKASLAIFLVSLVIVTFMAVYLIVTSRSTITTSSEKMHMRVFLLSLPLLLVRIIYSCVSVFANPLSFNSIYGNPTIMLCMALLEEMAVVLIYQGLGIVTLESADREKSDELEYGGTDLTISQTSEAK